MAQFFDSHPAKAASNIRKHGIDFEEAQTVWADHGALDFFDSEHSRRENRWNRIGISRMGRLLFVVYTDSIIDADSYVWLISARRATAKETRAYTSQ